ncbi:MAG: hypothetical protein CM1200mP36_07610 [Gammaproteobacteria bacterium]|nr:MAG: hypothetical protein CM1200mP36_07610 [Gammaproteobacteria bacterium]
MGVIIQMAVYAGFPAALNGMQALVRSLGNEQWKQTHNRPTEELPFIRSSENEG